jgi:hypothetical protein
MATCTVGSEPRTAQSLRSANFKHEKLRRDEWKVTFMESGYKWFSRSFNYISFSHWFAKEDKHIQHKLLSNHIGLAERLSIWPHAPVYLGPKYKAGVSKTHRPGPNHVHLIFERVSKTTSTLNSTQTTSPISIKFGMADLH